MKRTAQPRTHVFISYSHKDKDWLERLRVHLRPLERGLPQLEIWDDTRIKVGSKWRAEIASVITRTKVAVLLVTADFLASDFIANNELPPLLQSAESDGAKILSVILSPSRFEKMPSLSQFQTVNDPSEPLVDMERGKREAIFVKVADAIEELLATASPRDLEANSTAREISEVEKKRETRRGDARLVSTRDVSSKDSLDILKRDPAEWNRWRKYNQDSQPEFARIVLNDRNLAGINFGSANLSGVNLDGSNLSSANLRDANLEGASLIETDLTNADLTQAVLRNANLSGASLAGATAAGCDISAAILRRVDLTDADFREAKLSAADLERTILVGTNFTNADLSGCRVHGVSAWNLKLDGTLQRDLVITRPDEPTITADNIEVAQLLYLLLSNEKIRDVFDAISAKNVLILGRFTAKRKIVLESIRNEMRRRNYLPIVFDLSMPASVSITETLTTLAALARFIIADITDAKSIALELQALAPSVAVPIAPIIEKSSTPYAMFSDLLLRYPWVLPVSRYVEDRDLTDFLSKAVIAPAEAKVSELKEKMKDGFG